METEAILCTNCRRINEEARDVCEICGAPIGEWASAGRMEGVLTGKFHHQALARPTKFVIVLGVWLMFLPGALGFSYQSITLFSEGSYIGATLIGAFAALFLAVLIKTTKNYIKNKKEQSLTRG